MHRPIILTTLAVTLLAVPAILTGNPEALNNWQGRYRFQELQQARDAIKTRSSLDRFITRYDWLKPKYPVEYSEMVEASREAAGAWTKLVRIIESGAKLEEIRKAKEPAIAADSRAFIAEQELRTLGMNRLWHDKAAKANSTVLHNRVHDFKQVNQTILMLKKEEQALRDRIRRLEMQAGKIELEMTQIYDQRFSPKRR